MDILVCAPLYNHASAINDFLDSLGEVATLLFDDCSTPEVKDLIQERDLEVEVNKKEFFVNGCWNLGMKYFLNSEYTHLILATADVILCQNWRTILESNYYECDVFIPWFRDRKHLGIGEDSDQQLDQGTPIKFAVFNRENIEKVYPIPKELKLWYGDEWIFTILRETGDKVIQMNPLTAFDYGSICTDTPKANTVITEDKAYWEREGRSKMLKRIDELNQNDD